MSISFEPRPQCSNCSCVPEQETPPEALTLFRDATSIYNPIIMRLIVRSSLIHAAGVFTLEPIPKGTIVMEYTGTRMKHDDADHLYNERPYTYLFGVGDGTYVVDGYGMAMYLNHSCAPNCETEEDEDEHVWIHAIRDIDPSEELVYDYFLYDGEGDAPCTCGAKTCRGTMYSPKELKKRKRAEREKLSKRTAKGTRRAYK